MHKSTKVVSVAQTLTGLSIMCNSCFTLTSSFQLETAGGTVTSNLKMAVKRVTRMVKNAVILGSIRLQCVAGLAQSVILLNLYSFIQESVSESPSTFFFKCSFNQAVSLRIRSLFPFTEYNQKNRNNTTAQ